MEIKLFSVIMFTLLLLAVPVVSAETVGETRTVDIGEDEKLRELFIATGVGVFFWTVFFSLFYLSECIKERKAKSKKKGDNK